MTAVAELNSMATTIMSETKKKSAFATPDREIQNLTMGLVKKEPTPQMSEELKTVTPLDPSPKHVRFGKQGDSSPTTVAATNKSKRGLVSRRGGRYGSPSRLKSEGPGIVEYKAFRSPKRETESTDCGIPSLCSSHSGNLAVVKTIKQEEENPLQKPSSISCDAAETTSPLTSHDESTAGAASTSNKKKNTESRGVTFSPRPEEVLPERTKKTPTRSPPGGHFQTLPSLQDAKLSSPCGIFLSPCPPSPSAYATIVGPPKFQEEKSTKISTESLERERAVATPTDFAVDFGKGHQHSASFDASNVLAWLQSPTANGLFSPGGGFGSASNTPRAAPRTPRTPTMSTSFFFSDVASLPRNGEFASPKEPKAQRGSMNTISISPLASSKRKSSESNTPLNYKDVFLSPCEQQSCHTIKPRCKMPFLGESPTGKNKDIDGVHIAAARDLMEDEDLSVLLQLASHSNTPRSSKDGSDVFRSPRGRSVGNFGDSNQAPQLPIIGGQADRSTTKLSRKSISQIDPNAEDFAPPPLGIRSTSSGASREVFSSDNGERNGSTKLIPKEGTKELEGSSASVGKKGKKKKRPNKVTTHNGYPIPPHPYHADGAYGYHMSGGMPAMPPGGRMRVVVGAHPPMGARSGVKKSSGTSSPRGSAPRHPPYPMAPDGYGTHSLYPPPPHYHHPPHIAVPPPYGYPPPPPPRHMPTIYPSSHPVKGSNKGSAKKSKGVKGQNKNNKRPAPVVSASGVKGLSTAPKKPRKQQPKATIKKKRATTATTTSTGEGMDRQKAAAAIAAVNAASGGKNDRAAALAAAILRGVTMRPSGKWVSARCNFSHLHLHFSNFLP